MPCNFHNFEWTDTSFYVVDVAGPTIAGLHTCEKLNIVTMHCAIQHVHVPASSTITDVEEHTNQYHDRFEGIGDFPGEVKLYLDPGVQLHIDAPR
jgi:hypothetical protein